MLCAPCRVRLCCPYGVLGKVLLLALNSAALRGVCGVFRTDSHRTQDADITNTQAELFCRTASFYSRQASKAIQHQERSKQYPPAVASLKMRQDKSR